jgi:acyl-CoA thioesterase
MAPGQVDPGTGPFAALLGVRRLGMADGRACLEVTVGADHLNPHGIAHGGVLYTLVDYAMGGALTSRLEPGERCATLEIKIQYLAPVTAGPVRAEAWLVQRTRRIGVLEGRVHAADEQLVALATGTFFIQAPDAGGAAAPRPAVP